MKCLCRHPPVPSTEAPVGGGQQEELRTDVLPGPQATKVAEAVARTQSDDQAGETMTSHPPEPTQLVTVVSTGEEPRETAVELSVNPLSTATGDNRVPMGIEETSVEQEPPSIAEPPRTARLKSVVEQGCSKDQRTEEDFKGLKKEAKPVARAIAQSLKL